jgi:hypothetical protein
MMQVLAISVPMQISGGAVEFGLADFAIKILSTKPRLEWFCEDLLV